MVFMSQYAQYIRGLKLGFGDFFHSVFRDEIEAKLITRYPSVVATACDGVRRALHRQGSQLGRMVLLRRTQDHSCVTDWI